MGVSQADYDMAEGYERACRDHEDARKRWLEERAVLQRRIRRQRKELRHMGARYRGLSRLLHSESTHNALTRANSYRHAAQLAETFWFGGKRIAAYIRKWG